MIKKLSIGIISLLLISSFQSSGQSIKCLKQEYPVYTFVVEMPGYSDIRCWESVRDYLKHTYDRTLDELDPGDDFITYDIVSGFTSNDKKGREVLSVSATCDFEFEFKDGRFKYSVIFSDYEITNNRENRSLNEIMYESAVCDGEQIIKYFYSNQEW
jgi:hypothetical protein